MDYNFMFKYYNFLEQNGISLNEFGPLFKTYGINLNEYGENDFALPEHSLKDSFHSFCHAKKEDDIKGMYESLLKICLTEPARYEEFEPEFSKTHWPDLLATETPIVVEKLLSQNTTESLAKACNLAFSLVLRFGNYLNSESVSASFYNMCAHNHGECARVAMLMNEFSVTLAQGMMVCAYATKSIIGSDLEKERYAETAKLGWEAIKNFRFVAEKTKGQMSREAGMLADAYDLVWACPSNRTTDRDARVKGKTAMPANDKP